MGYIKEYKEDDILEIYNLGPRMVNTEYLYIIGNPLNYVFYISVFLAKYLRKDIYYIPFLNFNVINILTKIGNTKISYKKVKHLLNFNLKAQNLLIDVMNFISFGSKVFDDYDVIEFMQEETKTSQISCCICRTKSNKLDMINIKSYKNKCCICLTNFTEIVLGCGCGTYCKSCIG